MKQGSSAFVLGCPVRGICSAVLAFQPIKSVLGFIAKKLCPELIMVGHHFDHYMDISQKIMNIFREYDPNMLAAGCDEGYLKYVTVSSATTFIGLTGYAALQNIAGPTK
jgi:nucleotidyltransferase/DNA polymerase involved in DNA repair